MGRVAVITWSLEPSRPPPHPAAASTPRMPRCPPTARCSRGSGRRAPPAPPGWLKPPVRVHQRRGLALVYVFWAVLALLVLALLYFIGRELIRIRLPERKKKLVIQEDWRPTSDAALALLSDVDALADKGPYDEAVHLLPLRSINDIQGRPPMRCALP